MSLSRVFSGLLSPSSQRRSWSLLRTAAALAPQYSPLSTVAAVEKRLSRGKGSTKLPTQQPAPVPEPPNPPADDTASELQQTSVAAPKLPALPKEEHPRPSEIPWQVKVANTVHLIGSVGLPVQVAMDKGGNYTAFTVLSQDKDSDLPKFCIPIIFPGDLAEIAPCHLKEKDTVYITGHLTGDALPSSIKDVRTSLQVIVHSLSFVQELIPTAKKVTKHKESKRVGSHSADMPENDYSLPLWEDLLTNPHKWWDNRLNKIKQDSAEFRHKDSGQLLRISESTPQWVLAKLDSLDFNNKTGTQVESQTNVNVKKSGEPLGSSWADLIANPHEWLDCRMHKQNRLVKPRYPDFKHKNTKQGLWLDKVPDWVSVKLDSLEFEMENFKIGNQAPTVPSKTKNGEELWKNLVENPCKWWDNRQNKLKPNHPDFKHKETGEALWMGPSTPTWVFSKLPPSENKQKVS